MRRMFTFAVERDILETSPMFGVKPLTKKVAKDRVLTADEIKLLWAGLDTAAVSDEIKRALRLILVTAARPGEVIGMHTSEIDGDWWEIPAERSKNGIVHRVFLTKTAKELIGPLEGLDVKTGKMVAKGLIFPSPRVDIGPETEKPIFKPIDVNALAYAVRRNLKDYKRQRAPRKTSDSDTPVMVPVRDEKKIDMQPFTPHDLRRTAATLLAELGYSNEIIDAILGHKARGVVAVYNRHDYAKEKQAAAQALERKLKYITTGAKGVNVTPISAGRKQNAG
jgi:integrase